MSVPTRASFLIGPCKDCIYSNGVGTWRSECRRHAPVAMPYVDSANCRVAVALFPPCPGSCGDFEQKEIAKENE